MTPFQLALLALLKMLPAHVTDADEPMAAREGRLALVAVAVSDATHSDMVRTARVIALGQSESGFARYVGEGRCAEGPVGSRCDPDRRGIARALGYWQQHRSACPRAWALPIGSVEQLRESARCADNLLRSALHRCKRRVADAEAGSFSGYRSWDCSWRGGAARAERSRRYRVHLSRLLGAQ